MSGPQDTEILLALLSSLLDNPPDDSALLLDALVQADGDVEQAAEVLKKRGNGGSKEHSTQKYFDKSTTGVKRKRKQGLEGWLIPPGRTRSRSATPPSSKKKPSTRRDPSSTRISPNKSHNSSDFVEGSSRNASPVKPVKPVSQTEFMSMLRPSSSKGSPKPLLPKYAPLTLATPELVSKHVPCTMHLSVLPSELACRLYYAMLDHSENWQRNKWWLFDRVVESPHRTSFFVRRSTANEKDAQEVAQFWYNGRPTPPPDYFPPEMEEACEYIERIVNTEMRKRERYPLEWGGEPSQEGEAVADEPIIWQPNVAASNRYEGGSESVGFHSDQLTYLGPYPTIASLSLGTTRVFRLREVIPTDEKDKRSARTYNIPLLNNSLTIMHASCQERFKHSIPPQTVIEPFHPSFPRPGEDSLPANFELTGHATPAYNARINITFRFYRPDFHPSSIPRCLCGVPCILRPDMKNRYVEEGKGKDKDLVQKYWWTCYAGAQNDGKGCTMWKVMDVKAEGRGPFAGDAEPTVPG